MRKGQIVYCRACSVGYAYGGKTLPPVCPECEYGNDDESIWTTTPPFTLTKNDKRFLKSLRIQSDAGC